jgi:hypothetical protein
VKIANSKPVKPVAKKQDKGISTNGFKNNPFTGANPFGKKNPFAKKPKFNL